MLGLLTLPGGLTALLGMSLGYYLDIVSSTSIVLVSALLFAGVWSYWRFG